MAFKSLSTSNLPDPVIDPAQDSEPRDYFETFLYTGNGTGLQVGDVIKKPADTTTISNSLVFVRASDAYLSKSSVEGDDRKKITISLWFKRSSHISSSQSLISAGWSGSGWLSGLSVNTAGNILWFNSNSGGSGTQGYISSDLALTDTSNWHHVVAIWDTTETTSTDRMRLYLDGVRLTVTNITIPSQNALSYYLSQSGNNGYYIGQQAYSSGNDNFDGYMAEIHYIDGYVYEPTTFGAFDANGIWIPKAVTGVTYGTAGWHLDFSDGTSTTTLGEDSSGNNADWTLNNFATTDQVTDSPTDNFCTWSKYTPLTTYTTTLSEGNLTASYYVPTNTARINGSIGVSSGKWYYEFQSSAGSPMIGWCETNGDNAYVYDGNAANKRNYAPFNGSSTSSAYGATWTTTDVIGVALDLDNGTLAFYKNNTSQGTAYTGLSGTFTPTFGYQGGTTVTGAANFGQRGFTYTPPTGYLALSENNITVDDQNLESPDFVWIKNRDQADAHHWYDSVRGVQKALYSNAITLQTDEPNGLLDFNKNGFTIGSEVEVNTSGEDYVAWCWKAGGTASSNTDGSVTSTVSANSTSGISLVKWTVGSGTHTIGHGLGGTPDMLIHRSIDTAVTQWWIWHVGLSNPQQSFIQFTTGAAGANTSAWVNTAPTSTVFTQSNYIHTAGAEAMAWCFRSVDGYSKFGSYTGNGSTTDGPFVYTGFRPAWVMVKRSNTSGDSWLIFDSARETYNVMTTTLDADTNSAEDSTSTYHNVDFVSNGFKLREDGGGANASGSTYIYMAFAETPFKYATAR